MGTPFQVCWRFLVMSGAVGLTATPLAAQTPAPFLSPRVLAIYQADGSLQCQAGEGTSLEAVKKILQNKGAAVLMMERRRLPVAVPAECGTPTGTVNFFEVQVDDKSTLDLRPGLPQAFTRWPYEESRLVVSIRDGATVCSPVGRTLESSARTLVGAGVVPLEQFVAKNPKPTSQACMVPAGDTHLFRIPASQLGAARKLKMVEQTSRTTEECREVRAPAWGSPEAQLLTPPQTSALIVPNFNDVPRQMRGASVEVIFALSDRGVVDSVRFVPAFPNGAGTRLEKSLKSYRWLPAIYHGCYVATSATLSFTFGSPR